MFYFIIITTLEWPETYYVVHAGFKLTAILYHSFPSAGITGKTHYAQPNDLTVTAERQILWKKCYLSGPTHHNADKQKEGKKVEKDKNPGSTHMHCS